MLLSFGAFRLIPAGVELCNQPLGPLCELPHFGKFPGRKVTLYRAGRGVLKSCNRWHCAEPSRFSHLRRDVNRPGSQYGAHVARLLLSRSVLLQAVGLFLRSDWSWEPFSSSMSEARKCGAWEIPRGRRQCSLLQPSANGCCMALDPGGSQCLLPFPR